MQSFFEKRVDFETLMRHALMCDDELDRRIEIKQFYNGNLSPSYVRLDAVGLGVASRIKLVGPVVDAFVRPRLSLDDDADLVFFFAIDRLLKDRNELEDFSKQFTRVPERSTLLIDIEGRFAGNMSYLLMLFDRASKQLASEWCTAGYDPRVLNLPLQTIQAENSDEDDADAA
ncbi:hypothetical protein [Ochrobactrum sp. CGA5]|uniref:hypothetical protein n=1 Tax=Ochrobactrum sp. CGA5 TaxID=2583453 RepID=UPI00111E554F|nr:hypothetical protein [Ochrobactrum sp. CGA5]